MTVPTVYLDNSVLGRHFDDQSQPRIYLESSAIVIILALIEQRQIALVVSDVLDMEIARNLAPGRRTFSESIVKLARRRLMIGNQTLLRAREIEKMKIKPIDSLHLAAAEQLKVDYCVTCDDHMRERYQGHLVVVDPMVFVDRVRHLQADGGNI